MAELSRSEMLYGKKLTEQINLEINKHYSNLPQQCLSIGAALDSGAYYDTLTNGFINIIHNGFIDELNKMLELTGNEKIDVIKKFISNEVSNMVSKCIDKYYDNLSSKNISLAYEFKQRLKNCEINTLGEIDNPILKTN